MGDDARYLRWLYLINTALLATHEIDSAYWHEWKLFHLPGGLDMFLMANLVLLLIVLIGFDRVARLARGTVAFSCLLASAGVFAFVIHIIFIAVGHTEFRTPVSLTLLGAILAVSIAQFVAVKRYSRHQGTSMV